MEGQTFAQLLPLPTRTSSKLSVNLGVRWVNDRQLRHRAEAWGRGSTQLQTAHQYSLQAAEVLGLVSEPVHRHIPPSYSMAAKLLQTQAGAPREAASLPEARPDPAPGEEWRQQPWDGAAWIHFPRFLFRGCFCLSDSPICICCFAISSHKSLLRNSSWLWALAGCSLPPDSRWDFSPALQSESLQLSLLPSFLSPCAKRRLWDTKG